MENRLHGPLHDVAEEAGYADPPERAGFFTDTSVCIGCKACEVACKEWNAIPSAESTADGFALTGMSYDNTGALGASTWRHVAFVEQSKPREVDDGVGGSRWLMASDVCKHCTHAACLDVCPTGALFRTEFDTVVVQEDVCNGCGYCIPACPYGVIDQRKGDGRAWKCTMCYDRIGVGMEPACAKACPTDSIQYGPLDELRERAAERIGQLHDVGVTDARLYGHDPDVYGLPPDPVVTTRDLPDMWRHAGAAAITLLGGLAAVFAAHARTGRKR
jgi:formate dehydrogenase iron-sulfur subunit